MRLTHGNRKSFVLAFTQDLGSVRLVNVEWRYDHEIDFLDPLKVCVLILCSDSVYMQNVGLSTISFTNVTSISSSSSASNSQIPKDSSSNNKKIVSSSNTTTLEL